MPQMRQELPTHTDPGLQPERTAMSWTRTSISMLVAASILLRWAGAYGPGIFALMALLVASAVFVVLSNRAAYAREVQGIKAERVEPAMRRVFVLTAAVVALGCGAVAVVLAA